jgi:prolyl-tRNA synthetase
MRSRPFLRTTEFFWQEGHTAHETEKEAIEEMELMFSEYQKLAKDYLAIPVIVGRKTDSERFPGAVITKTFEGMMPDGKALQMGTSHYLSQTFAHAFDMKFQNKEEKIAYPYLTSWGVTTRLIGALVMTHGDNQGLIIPPRIAPIQVVIIPIVKKDDNKSGMLEYVNRITESLKNHGIRVYLDAAEHTTPGEKFYQWELKGVPLRLDVGNREYQEQMVMSVNRVTKSKVTIFLSDIEQKVVSILNEIQDQMLKKAEARLKTQEIQLSKLQDFANDLEQKGGFYYTSWCGIATCEATLKTHKASIRCIISDEPKYTECFCCDQNAKHQIAVARAY